MFAAPRSEFLALAVISLCLLVELALLPVGLDDMDEGYFAEQATRVLRGEVPYRDFDTLYTPGLLYLHAGLFLLSGQPHILIPRLLSFLSRVALALGLYATTRSLAGPGWAALPALFLLLGLDHSPLNWEPHPNWQSALCTVLAVWLFGTLPSLTSRRRIAGLLGVGALAALGFAFKQNAGLLIGISAAGFLLLQGVDPEARPVTPLTRAVQLGVLATVLAALGVMFQRHSSTNALLFLYLWAPVAAVGLLLAFSGRLAWRGQGLVSRLHPLLPLTVGFGVATLPWLLMLLASLHGQTEYLGGFVGAVDLRPLSLPIELPTSWTWLAVLGIGLMALAAVRAGRFLGSVPLVLIAGFGAAVVPLTREPAETLTTAALLAPGRAADGLQSIVPIAAIWGGIWLARHRARNLKEWLFRWYVAAAAVSFLTQYPRMDNFHLLWSACVPLVVGAICLQRLHCWLARRWRLGRVGSYALACALSTVPALVILPNLYVRGEGLVKLNADSEKAEIVPLTRITGIPAVDGVQVPKADRDQIVGLVRYLRENTAPGEPIFVYPTSPLVYVAADRPNPTRYAHLYPNAASSDELERLITSLQAANVQTLVVSDGWLFVWSPPGDNARLEDYLGSTYRDAARIGTYRVLSRK